MFNKRSTQNSQDRDRRTTRSTKFCDLRKKDRSEQKRSRHSQAATLSPPPPSHSHRDRPPPVATEFNSTGKVTQIDDDCGVVNDEVFFPLHVCHGKIPQLGNHVQFEAHPGTSSLRRQCSWIATRIEKLSQPSSRSRSSPRNGDAAAVVSRRGHWSPPPPEHLDEQRYSDRKTLHRSREQLQRRSRELLQNRRELQRSRSRELLQSRRELQRSRSRELQRSRSRELQRSRSRKLQRSRSREQNDNYQRERKPGVMDRRQRHSNDRHESNRMDDEQKYQSQQWDQRYKEEVIHAVVRENLNELPDYEEHWDARRDISPTEFQNQQQQQQQQSWSEPRNNNHQNSHELEDGFRNRMAMMEQSNDNLNWQRQQWKQSRSRSRTPENNNDRNRCMDFNLHERNFGVSQPLAYQMQQQRDSYMRDEKEQRERESEREFQNYNREPQMQSHRQSPDHSWQIQNHHRDEEVPRKEFQNAERNNRRRNSEEDRDFRLQNLNRHSLLKDTTQNVSSNNHMDRREEQIFQNQATHSRNRHHVLMDDDIAPTIHQFDESLYKQDVFQNQESQRRDIHDLNLDMVHNERLRREQTQNQTNRQSMIMQESYLSESSQHPRNQLNINQEEAFQSQQMREQMLGLGSNNSQDQQWIGQIQNPFQTTNTFIDNGADDPSQPSQSVQGQTKRLSGAEKRKLAREHAFAERQYNKANFREKVREKREAKALRKNVQSEPELDHIAMKAKYKWVKTARTPLLETPSVSFQLPPQVPNSLGIVEPARTTDRQQPRYVPNSVGVAQNIPQFANSLDYYRQKMSSSTRLLSQVSNSKKTSTPARPKLLSKSKTVRQIESEVPNTSTLSPQPPPPPIIRQQPNLNSKNLGIKTTARPVVPPPPPIIRQKFNTAPARPTVMKPTPNIRKPSETLNNQFPIPQKAPKLSKDEKQEKKRKVWCILMDDAHPKGFISPWHSRTLDQTFKTALASANLTSLIKRGWMNQQHVYRITLASPNNGLALQTFVDQHFRKPWPEAQMRLIIGSQLTIVTVFVPLRGGRYNPRAILKKLQKQNKQLHTHLWQFVKSVHVDAGIKIFVAIDGKSFEALAEKMGKVPYIKTMLIFKHGGYPVGKEKNDGDDDDDIIVIGGCDDDAGCGDCSNSDDNDDEVTDEDDE